MDNRQKLVLIIIAVILTFLLSCEKDYEYRSANFYPGIGDTITISERGAPSNGIWWQLRKEPNEVVEKVDSCWVQDSDEVLLGGQGTFYWKFVAYEYGSVILDYWYWRPYGGRETIEAKHQYTVRVR